MTSRSTWKRPFGALAFALLFAGCTTYLPPAEGTPTAELILEIDQDAVPHHIAMTVTSIYAFEVDGPNDCSHRGKLATPAIATQGMLYGNAKGPVNIEANKRLYMLASTRFNRGGATGYSCDSYASFVPETGHSYDTQHKISDRTCDFIVTDRATGRRPDTYMSYARC